MSDPIADIIDECAVNLEPPNEDSFVPFEKRDQIIAYTAKQIRQQIGRELLAKTGNAVSIPESNKWADGWNDCRDVIREVCQLEES